MTHKRKLRGIAILITLVFLLSLLPAGMASAASEYTALSVPSVPDDDYSDLGTVLIKVTAGSIDPLKIPGNTAKVNLRLPSDFEFDLSKLSISTPARYGGDPNGLYGANWKVTPIADNEVQLYAESVKGTVYVGDEEYTGAELLEGFDGYMYVYLKNIYVPAGTSGDIELTASAPSTSGFTSGSVVVGRCKGGEVTVSVDEVETFTDDVTVTLRFKESIKESFEIDKKSVKLRLPDGFEWSSVGTPTLMWGDQSWLGGNLSFTIDGRDLYLDVSGQTSSSTYFSVPVTISVEDETKAKYGDVTVTISGVTDVSPSSLVVAKYAEMGATVSCPEPTTVVAGKTEEEIGDIVIEETAPGSLVEGRSITLTLPANAKWGALPTVDTENDLDIDTSKGDQGFDLVGSDGRTLKFWIGSESSDEAGKITLEDAEVILAGDVTGDLVIEVGGTANVSGKVKVATIVAPVTATASAKPEVKIGMNDQPAGDITITEGAAESIKDDANIEIYAPLGVKFSEEPKVEVVSGDLDLDVDNVRLSDDDRTLIIPVDAESTTASTIKITDIKLDVDRTVPVGDIELKIGGLALNEVNDSATLDDYYGEPQADGYYYIGDLRCFKPSSEGEAFPGATWVAKVVNATCVTPAPGETKVTATLQIGNTTMKVNGVDVTMDVAPYLKNSRTYVPVRFCAKALGIDESNIIWDGATQTATIVAGAKVIQMKVGSKTMVVNGAPVPMDTAPELVPPGRVCLPIGWLAWALGAKTSWDNATQTATLEL